MMRLKRQTKTGANRRLAVTKWVVSYAYARRKIEPLGFVKLMHMPNRSSCHLFIETFPGSRNDRGQQTVAFFDGTKVIVPQAQ